VRGGHGRIREGFQQRSGGEPGHLLRYQRADLGDAGADELAAEERSRLRPQRAGSAGHRGHGLEPQARGGQAAMLFRQFGHDLPRHPEQRERGVEHVGHEGRLGGVEEDIAGGEVEAFPCSGQGAGAV
jgi:hypothetical protein